MNKLIIPAPVVMLCVFIFGMIGFVEFESHYDGQQSAAVWTGTCVGTGVTIKNETPQLNLNCGAGKGTNLFTEESYPVYQFTQHPDAKLDCTIRRSGDVSCKVPRILIKKAGHP